MKPLNPYVGFTKGEQEEAACLIFAHTAREAKKVGWSIVRGWMLYADDFIDMRVKRLEKTPYIMSFCKQDISHATEEMPMACEDCLQWGVEPLREGRCESCQGETVISLYN